LGEQRESPAVPASSARTAVATVHTCDPGGSSTTVAAGPQEETSVAAVASVTAVRPGDPGPACAAVAEQERRSACAAVESGTARTDQAASAAVAHFSVRAGFRGVAEAVADQQSGIGVSSGAVSDEQQDEVVDRCSGIRNVADPLGWGVGLDAGDPVVVMSRAAAENWLSLLTAGASTATLRSLGAREIGLEAGGFFPVVPAVGAWGVGLDADESVCVVSFAASVSGADRWDRLGEPARCPRGRSGSAYLRVVLDVVARDLDVDPVEAAAPSVPTSGLLDSSPAAALWPARESENLPERSFLAPAPNRGGPTFVAAGPPEPAESARSAFAPSVEVSELVVSPVSADATAAEPSARPIPSATASAPTRPT